MSEILETKNFELEFKDVDSQGKIRGYASTFGNVDLGNDVVDEGAFAKSIKEKKGKFPILADHDPRRLIGWNLQAKEDKNGLLVEGELNLQVQDAREKYALAKQALENGIKMGLSIGYAVIKSEPDRKNQNIRRLKELKLYEYSIVTFPMNESALVTSLKSINTPIHVDNIKTILAELEKHGITKAALQKALSENPIVQKEFDPTKVSQSLDNLLNILKK